MEQNLTKKRIAQTIQKSLWDEVPLMGVEEIIATVNEEVNITKKIMLLIECNRRSLTGKIIIVLTFANDNRVNIINTNIQQYAR
jgi:flagellar biosynthesis component FlhA